MRVKKILSLAVVLAMVMAVVPTFGLVAGAAAETVTVGGVKYEIKSANLFPTDLADWTSGTGTGSWGTGSNVIPKHDTVGKIDGSWSTAEDDVIGEYITESYGMSNNCGWNMVRSPLIFVKIDPTKTYYFGMKYRNNKNDSMHVRYGAINEASYTTDGGVNGKITFSGTGYRNNKVSHTSGATLPGTNNAWKDEVSIIKPGSDADYFIFNDAWMDSQVHSFAQMVLYEVEEIPSDASVTVQYVDGETVVDDKVYTIENLYSGDECDIALVDTYTIHGGYVYYVGELSDSATVYDTITLAKDENIVKIPVTKYRQIKGSNIIADQNPGFEEGIKGLLKADGTQVPDNDDLYKIVSDNKTEGNNALWEVGTRSDGGTPVHINWSGVQPGKQYVVMFDVKATVGDGINAHQYAWFYADAAAGGKRTNYGDYGAGDSGAHIRMVKDQFVKKAMVVDTTAEQDVIGFSTAYGNDAAPVWDNFSLYEIERLSTQHDVQVDYTVNGKVIDTVKGEYDETVTPDGFALDEKYYYVQGTSSLYHADAMKVKAAELVDGVKTVEMTALDNNEPLKEGQVVIAKNDNKEDAAYKVAGKNLVANGDFKYGLNGWYNGKKVPAGSDAFTVNDDGTVNFKDSKGSDSIYSLWGIWPIQAGKTYVIQVDSAVDTESFTDTVYMTKEITTDEGLLETDGNKERNNGTVIVGVTGNKLAHGLARNGFPAGLSYTAFTVPADSEYKYLSLLFRWHSANSKVGNFALYEATADPDSEVKVTVNYKLSDDAEPVHTVSKVGLKGEDISFERYEYSEGLNFYAADAVTYKAVSEDAVYDIIMKNDDTKIVSANVFGHMFNTNVAGTEGENGYYMGPFSWTRNALFMAFDIPEGKALDTATLNYYAGKINNEGENYAVTVYAVNPTMVDAAEGAVVPGAYGLNNWEDRFGAVTVAATANKKPAVGWNTVDIDFASPLVGDVVLMLKVESHDLYVAGKAHGAGAHVPYLSDVKYAENAVEVPTLTAKLGWNEGAFTIDYVAGDVTPVEGAIYKVDVASNAEAVLGGDGEFDPEVYDGVGFVPGDTNDMFTATPVVIIDGTEYKGYTVGKVGVYGLVMEAIAASQLTGEINAEQLKVVNEILKNGNILLTNGELTDAAKLVMTISEDKKTVTLKDEAVKLGLKFTDGIGAGKANTDEPVKATVSEDGKSVTLNDAATAEAMVLSLEGVYLEFVPTDVSETQGDGADADLGLVDEL